MDVEALETPSHEVKDTHRVYRCPERGCNRVLKHEKGLKRHMKRHTPPYSCTFTNCNKYFGSRNDWKRHESSQHNDSMMWRYTAQSGFGEEVQVPELDGFLHNRNNSKREFWCGFCNRFIRVDDVDDPFIRYWDIRFKHIGVHFDKEGKNIGEWVDVEAKQKKATKKH